MDADERRAAFAQAKAESLDALERLADVEVRQRDYSKPDALEEWRRNMPPRPAPPPVLTVDEVKQEVADALAQYHEGKQMRPLTREVVAAALAEIRKQVRKEFAEEIAKLKSEFDLRLSALLQATEKLERGISGGDRAAEIIDLPALPVRSPRRG